MMFYDSVFDVCVIRWYADSRALSAKLKRRDAIRNIRYYYANVVNGASIPFTYMLQ